MRWTHSTRRIDKTRTRSLVSLLVRPAASPTRPKTRSAVAPTRWAARRPHPTNARARRVRHARSSCARHGKSQVRARVSCCIRTSPLPTCTHIYSSSTHAVCDGSCTSPRPLCQQGCDDDMLAVRACSRSRVQSGLRRVALLNTAISVDPTTGTHRSWQQARGNSTQAGSTNSGSTGTYVLASAAAVIGGLAGFYFAHPTSDTPTHNRPIKFNDQYGTPKDFQNAIQELRKALPSEDMVSTDPNVLASHGQPFGSDRTGTSKTLRFRGNGSDSLVSVFSHGSNGSRVSVVHRRRREDRQYIPKI